MIGTSRVVSGLGASLLLFACSGSSGDPGSSDGGADGGTGDTVATVDAGACGRTEPVASCWTDPTTKLTWENPATPAACNWQGAVDDCSALSACGHDDWRLPNIDELRTLMRGCAGTVTGGACPIHVGSPASDFTSACYCTKLGGPSAGGCFWDPVFGEQCGYFAYLYWSFSETAVAGKNAWAASYFDGRLLQPWKTDKQRLRCVRP